MALLLTAIHCKTDGSCNLLCRLSQLLKRLGEVTGKSHRTNVSECTRLVKLLGKHFNIVQKQPSKNMPFVESFQSRFSCSRGMGEM